MDSPPLVRAATLAGTLASSAADAAELLAGVRASCARPLVDRIAIDRRIADRVLA